MKVNFAIGIPTINQWVKLKETLLAYRLDFPETEIFIVDNGRQISTLSLVGQLSKNEEPKGVAASWNQLCQMIWKKHTHALILNDDVYLGARQNEIQRLIENHAEDDFIVSQHGFCSFILPHATKHKIGMFDESFKGAYFEDNDYERRLKLAKLQITRCQLLNPVWMETSASIKADPSLNVNFQNNSAYYEQKWGGARGGETFLTPFNQ